LGYQGPARLEKVCARPMRCPPNTGLKRTIPRCCAVPPLRPWKRSPSVLKRGMGYVPEHAEKILKSLYSRLWSSCFPGDQAPATLFFRESDLSSGYRREHNDIYICVGGWDKDLLDAANPVDYFPPGLADWQSWHLDLAEEVAHEYQHKVLRFGATDEGRILHSKFSPRFDPEGHGPDFFSAVARVARCLDLEPDRLADALRRIDRPWERK
jgi:hypothetical protein